MAKAKRSPQTRKKIGGPRPEGGGPRADKVAAVAEIKDRLTASAAVFITEYRGMTVGELAALRTELRKAGGEYKVVKNTLATIAAREAGIEDLLAMLEGPTAWAWIAGDAIAAAKSLSEFTKRAPALVVKGALFEGKVFGPAQAKALASLESREVLLSRTAGMFLSPIQQAANLFAAPLNKLGAGLAALRDKREKEEAAA